MSRRRRFERQIRSTPLTARWTRYDAVKGLPIVASLPVLRELFTNPISVVLEKPTLATVAAH